MTFWENYRNFFSFEFYNLAGLVSTQQFGLALSTKWSRKPCSTTCCISFVLYKKKIHRLSSCDSWDWPLPTTALNWTSRRTRMEKYSSEPHLTEWTCSNHSLCFCIICVVSPLSLPPAITVTLTKHGGKEFKSKKRTACLEHPS